MLLALLLVLAQAVETPDAETEARIDEALEQLQSDDDNARGQAADHLGELGPAAKRAVPALLKRFADKDSYPRHTAVEAVSKIGDVASFPRIFKLLTDKKFQENYYVQEAVARLAPLASGGVAQVVKAVNGKDVALRERAAGVITFMEFEPLVPYYKDVLKWAADANAEVREAGWARLDEFGVVAAADAIPIARTCLANFVHCPLNAVLDVLELYGDDAGGVVDALKKARDAGVFQELDAGRADAILYRFETHDPNECPMRVPGETFPPRDTWSAKCESGNMECCFNIGQCSLRGFGYPQKWDVAKEMLGRVCSSEAPHKAAACDLIAKMKESDDRAIAEYEKAHPPGQYGWKPGYSPEEVAARNAETRKENAERHAAADGPKEHVCMMCSGSGQVYSRGDSFTVDTPIMSRRQVLTGSEYQSATLRTTYAIPSGYVPCPICHGTGVRVF